MLLLETKDNNPDKPKFSKNKSSLHKFLISFNKAFPEHKIDNIDDISIDKNITGLVQPLYNYNNNINNLIKSDLYLYILDKPEDKLRISISNFYDSCLNLYTGSNREQLASSIFDKNSKVAYIMFNTDFIDNRGNKHPFTPIGRCILRINDDGLIVMDNIYGLINHREIRNILQTYGKIKLGQDIDFVHYVKDLGIPLPYSDYFDVKTELPITSAQLKEFLDKKPNLIIKKLFTVEYLSNLSSHMFDWLITLLNDNLKKYLLNYIISEKIYKNFTPKKILDMIDGLLFNNNDNMGIDKIKPLFSEDELNRFASDLFNDEFVISSLSNDNLRNTANIINHNINIYPNEVKMLIQAIIVYYENNDIKMNDRYYTLLNNLFKNKK